MLLKTLCVSNQRQLTLVGRLFKSTFNYSPKKLAQYHSPIARERLSLATKNYENVFLIEKRKFHTTRCLRIPPYLALLIRPLSRVGAFVFGRLLKRWWAKKTPKEKELYKKWFSARRKKIYVILAGALAYLMVFYIYHMEEDPLTGRLRFILLNKEQQKVLNDAVLQNQLDISEGKILPQSHPAYRRVSKITNKLLKANQDLSAIAEREWTVTVVDSKETNAFVLAGGNIFVCLGLLDMVENDDQLAFVLAHEMSHVLLMHSMESISLNFLLDILLAVPITVIWAMAPNLLAITLQYFGVSLADVLITLPYSRTLEKEADEIGLKLASRACVDIREAVVFWAMMHKLTEIKREPSIPWLSTHPADEDRAEYLRTQLPEAMELRSKSGCWGLGHRDPLATFHARSQKDHQKHFERKGLLN